MKSYKTSGNLADLDSEENNLSESSLPPERRSGSQLLSKTKSRLATTRGLRVIDKGPSLDHITPSNTPSKFHPTAGSTPVTESSSIGHRNPLNNKLLGISSLQRPPHPHQSVPSDTPVSSIRVSVIHPREDSDGDPIAAASASLDWDNFNESPSFTISGEPHLQQNLQIGDCLKEVESLSEEVQRVTVDQEAIMSFSKPTSKSEMEMEISRENEKLKEMKEHINEMMEDYTEDDVGEGNVELVDRELKEIANARAEFRTSIKEYKKKFGTFHPQNCNTLDGYLAEVNQQIRSHANSIWAKVASIKRNHQPSVLAPGSVSQPSATPQVSSQTTSQVTTSHGATAGDLEYKKSIFKDQLLYLTEALMGAQLKNVGKRRPSQRSVRQ